MGVAGTYATKHGSLGSFQLFAAKFLCFPGGNSPCSLPFPLLVVRRLWMTGQGICNIFTKLPPTQISNQGSKFPFLQRLPLQVYQCYPLSMSFVFVVFRIACHHTHRSCGLQPPLYPGCNHATTRAPTPSFSHQHLSPVSWLLLSSPSQSILNSADKVLFRNVR